MKNRRSFIIGISSFSLKPSEVKFLKTFKPWGIILFSRNIKSIKQTRNLTDSIKKIFNDDKYPILIDQEGGRVSRLSKLIDSSIFSGEFFGNLYLTDKNKFKTYYKIFIKQTSFLLNQIGININTVPVLDLRSLVSNKIIGDRSFSQDPKTVSRIGDFCIKEYHKNNIATVIKHIPGHGLAKVDSHKATPIIKKDLKYLLKRDFFTFKDKKSLFAMTAHIKYQVIDKNNTATHSSKIIKLIRNKIKFKNLIITDDISMKGLRYSISQNTTQAFRAGCDLVLHCNGNYEEMLQVAKNSPVVNNFIVKKTSQFYKIIS